MSKKITISKKPKRKKTSEEWISSNEKGINQNSTKRLTIDISENLHRKIKSSCAMKGVKMADEIRAILEKRFNE